MRAERLLCEQRDYNLLFRWGCLSPGGSDSDMRNNLLNPTDRSGDGLPLRDAQPTMIDKPSPLPRMDRAVAGEQGRFSWRWAVIASAVVLALVLIFLLVHRSRFKDVAKSDTLEFSTVRRGEFQDSLRLVATAVPAHTFRVDSAEGGRVDRQLVLLGQHVSVGDPLFVLKNTSLELQHLALRAQVAEARSRENTLLLQFQQNQVSNQTNLSVVREQLEDALDETRRNQNLQEKGYVSDLVVTELARKVANLREQQHLILQTIKDQETLRATTVESALRSSESLEGNLAAAEKAMSDLTVKAPIDGVITVVASEVGQVIPPGGNLAQLDPDNDFIVRASVDEAYINRFSSATHAVADVDGRQAPVNFLRVSPRVENERVDVDFVVPADGVLTLRRGQTVEIFAQFGQPAVATLLPNGPYLGATGGKWVFVRTSPNTAVRRPITIGRRNSDDVEILAGLHAGDVVITSAYDQYAAETAIRW
jgi:HlyD family secretion protein